MAALLDTVPAPRTAYDEDAPALDRDTVLRRYTRHVNTSLAGIARMVAAPVETRSAGTKVYGSDGEAYLDCGGFGVFLLGHCHPTVVGAVLVLGVGTWALAGASWWPAGVVGQLLVTAGAAAGAWYLVTRLLALRPRRRSSPEPGRLVRTGA